MSRNFIAGCTLFIIGCGELDIDEPALSEVSYEIGLGPHSSHGSGWEPIPLGSTEYRTCYLRGISGVLRGESTSVATADSAYVSVYPDEGMWWVKAKALTTPGLVAHVGCVYLPYAGIEFSWSENTDPGGSVSASPNRHCFLREVWAVYGLDGSLSPRGKPTNITIKEVDGQFTMAGSYLRESASAEWGSSGGATATCFDFPATREWDFTVAGPGPFDPGSTYTSHVRPAMQFTACGLTAVGGEWTLGVGTPSALDHGVVASTTNGAEWKVTATRSKQAGIHCVH